MNEPRRVRRSPAKETTASAPPPRRKGSPMLIILMIVVVLPSVLLADAWGAGAAGIIGGLTGMFSLVVFMGGPLRADLRITAVMGPLLVFAAAVPRLVAEASRPAAMALVVLLTIVAALLPVLGPRFGTAGLGLGMTTMFGYGYAPQGGADHQQVIAAAVAGVLVALLLRILMGISDPSKPTREQVAAVLVADDPGAATATAFGTWLSDRRQRWLADALEGASRYRIALRNAELTGASSDDLDALRARAKELSAAITAKPRKGDAGSDAASDAPAGTAADGPAGEASRALDAVETALRQRDMTPVHLERSARETLRDAVLHPSSRLRSIQTRHALRTALAVLAMLIITSGLERGDPLVSTALLATFSILQATWSETATKTRNKVIGVAAGSLAVAVVLLVVPSQYLIAVAAVALCLGLWYIVTVPAFGNACMVVVSVGFNSVSRDLNAVDLLGQYLLLTACAVVIGVLFGFVVIPGFRPAPLRVRVASAVDATAAALRASSEGSGPPDPRGIALYRDASRLQDELVPDREHLDDGQLAELERLRDGLRDLTVLADAAPAGPAELEQVVRALSPDSADADAVDGTAPAASGGESSTMRDLAEQVGAAERHLLATLPAPR